MTSRNSFYGWPEAGTVLRLSAEAAGTVAEGRARAAWGMSEGERLVAGQPRRGVHGDLEKGALPRLRPAV